MKNENVNEVLDSDQDELDQEIATMEDAVEPGAAASTDKEKGSKKKRKIYVVPEEKLTYPLQEDCVPWSLEFVKLKEDDFQSSKAFDQWECYEYLQARIDHLQAQFDRKIAPLREAIETAKIKLEKAEQYARDLGITEDSQKAAMAEGLGALNAATAAGVSYEQMLAAFSMFQESEQAKKDAKE